MRSGPSTPTVERDRSIDLLRGLLVVALVFFEWLPPGGFAWLRHSPWDGVRPADLVFPGYLFVVGSSIAVARRPASWARLLRRFALLVGLGLLFNAATTTDPLRFTGVLQTIAVAGVLASVVARWSARDAALVAGALLVVHGLVLDDAFAVDRWVLPDERLYQAGAAGHDPEGVLNTVLGGTAIVLLGAAATRRRSWWTAGVLAGATAAAWLVWEPNKRAWTPTFTLLAASTFTVALLLLRRGRLSLLEHAGRNALLVYVGQHVVREVVGPTSSEPLLLAAGAAVAWTVAAAALSRAGVRLRA